MAFGLVCCGILVIGVVRFRAFVGVDVEFTRGVIFDFLLLLIEFFGVSLFLEELAGDCSLLEILDVGVPVLVR